MIEQTQFQPAPLYSLISKRQKQLLIAHLALQTLYWGSIRRRIGWAIPNSLILTIPPLVGHLCWIHYLVKKERAFEEQLRQQQERLEKVTAGPDQGRVVELLRGGQLVNEEELQGIEERFGRYQSQEKRLEQIGKTHDGQLLSEEELVKLEQLHRDRTKILEAENELPAGASTLLLELNKRGQSTGETLHRITLFNRRKEELTACLAKLDQIPQFVRDDLLKRCTAENIVEIEENEYPHLVAVHSCFLGLSKIRYISPLVQKLQREKEGYTGGTFTKLRWFQDALLLVQKSYFEPNSPIVQKLLRGEELSHPERFYYRNPSG